MATGSKTLTGSQGSRCLGIVSGFVLGLTRRAAGATQEQLAESLGVDATTVQGWESGRRPLTAMRTGELLRVRMTLAQLGAPVNLGQHMNEALEADVLIATAVEAGEDWDASGLHPLALSVHRRSLIAMVTWPITGQRPPQLGGLIGKRGRGPAVSHPELRPDEQARFFDHLVAIADQTESGEHDPLRRQAIYLLGFDHRPATRAWLREEWARASRVKPTNSLSDLLGARTAAIARATAGDPDTLPRFMSCLTDELSSTANLNYWAHWIGELPREQANDVFMVTTDPRSWSGITLARHLTSRLVPGSPHLPLNLHSLHSLVSIRPGMLNDSPELRRLLADAAERVLSHDGLDGGLRDELAGLAYAVRIADR